MTTHRGPARPATNVPAAPAMASGACGRPPASARAQLTQDEAVLMLVRALAKQTAREEMKRVIASYAPSPTTVRDHEEPA